MKLGNAANPFDGSKCLGVGSGNQNVLLRSFLAHHGPDDCRNLRRGLAFSKNHFGITLAQSPMMIDFGEAQIFTGQVL